MLRIIRNESWRGIPLSPTLSTSSRRARHGALTLRSQTFQLRQFRIRTHLTYSEPRKKVEVAREYLQAGTSVEAEQRNAPEESSKTAEDRSGTLSEPSKREEEIDWIVWSPSQNAFSPSSEPNGAARSTTGSRPLGPEPEVHIRATYSGMGYEAWEDYYANYKDVFQGNSSKSAQAHLRHVSSRTITHKLMELQGGDQDQVNVNTAGHEYHGVKIDIPRFSSEEQAELAEYGYSRADAAFWASVKLEQDPYIAAQKVYGKTVHETNDRRTGQQYSGLVPTFVLMKLLKKRWLPTNAFRLLLVSVWWHLHQLTCYQREALYSSNQSPEVVSAQMAELVFKYFAALLAQARQVLPEAIVNVAALFYTYVSWFSNKDNYPPGLTLDRTQIQRLNILHNRAIALLSKPTSLDPMKSSGLLERAQFDVLASMVKHRPPIELNREGWRGIISVLLRRPKSGRDRKWAELKSLSWPPFMEPRIGFDQELTPDDGASKANEALKRMHEAGYRSANWEKIASIASGWDTDHSPTIQRRTILTDQSGVQPSNAEIWVARVRATRTLHEAWACFLSCEEETGHASMSVYEAMFEKIIYDAARQRSESIDDTSRKSEIMLEALPGDGIEVSPPPVSPTEAVNTQRPPPTFESFFDRMLADGIEPRAGLLALLLNHAPSFGVGLKVIQSCTRFYQGRVPKLLSTSLLSSDDISFFKPYSIEPFVLASVVKLLCRPLSEADLESLHDYESEDNTVSSWRSGESRPILHATRLVEALGPQPEYRPCWNHLLSALANLPLTSILPDSSEKSSKHTYLNRIHAAVVAQGIIARMRTKRLELDFTGFYHVCVCMEKAAIASRKLLKGEERPFFVKGSQYLRKTFQDLVGTASKDASTHLPFDNVPLIPKLLATPNPAQLHAYVRALGLFGDHEGILSLAQWMRANHGELNKSAAEELGGSRRMRRVFVAMRLLLEQPNRDPALGMTTNAMPAADMELLELVAREVASVEEWGGWPSPREVEQYCAN